MSADKRPSSLYVDLKKLRELFQEVDKEEKGYIDFDGLQEMISSMEEFDPNMAKELMETLDRDKDGKVTVEDFQTTYTVERDAIKEQQPSSNSLHENNGRSLSISSDSKRSTTSPFINPDLLTRVPDSPDLASHARSLRGTNYDLNDSSFQHSPASFGDIVLEDTGGIETAADDEPSVVTSPKPSHSFYGEIRKELEQICPTGIVEQEHVLKLSNALGLDAPDEQELLSTWEECEGEMVSVESMCHLLQEKEKISLISSVPSKLNTREAWQTEPTMDSPLALKDPPRKRSTPHKKLADVAEDTDSFDEDDTGGSDNEWISGTSYNFYDVTQTTPSRRPSSAREGSRLSRGYSETSLRQTAMMHSEYKSMQEKLVQAMSENDSLKSNFARVEEEKKKLIAEGEESVQLLHRIKQEEINAVKNDYNMRIKELERSFTSERQSIQDKAEQEVIILKEQLSKQQEKNKTLRTDFEYFKNDNAKLVEDLQAMRSEIKEKENKIARLHETFGIQMESPSDTDLEMQANRLQELERDLDNNIQLNEDLKSKIRELHDREDEWKEECEMLRMKLIEEKRRRQKRKSSAISLPTSHTSLSSSTLLTKKNKRDLPEIPPHRRRQHEETDSSSRHITYGSESDSMREHETSDDSDDFKTVSSASLLEEIRLEDDKQKYTKKMVELEAMRVQLETSKKELEKLNTNMHSENLKLQKLLQQSKDDKSSLESHLAQVKEEHKEAVSTYMVQIYKMKTEHETDEILNQELKQENFELHSKLLLTQNHSEETEERLNEITREKRQLEGRLQSLENQLKMKTNEAGLAIRDLTMKEEDYASLQERMQEVENELSDLRLTAKNYLSQIEQLEKESKEQDSKRIANVEESKEVDPALEAQELTSPKKRELTVTPIHTPAPLHSSSPFPFSPTRSLSSAEGQSEIVTQMKSQLEDLQRLLVHKSGQDVSDTELTVIQELLEMNNALEESIASQQRWYNSELTTRDNLIEDLQKLLTFLKSHLSESVSQTTENAQVIPELIQAMCDRIESLPRSSEVTTPADDDQRIQELKELLEKSMGDVKEGEKKRLQLEDIINRQQNELKVINHQLGKAKTLELKQSKEREEREKQLKEKNTSLQNKQMELLQLRETVERLNTSSMPSLHSREVRKGSGSSDEEEDDDLELLHSSLQKKYSLNLLQEMKGEIQQMNKEMIAHRKSTATAEELLHQLQKELSSFYNEIVGEPEEEDVANDDITMLNSIREAYYKLQEELSIERELLKESRENFEMKSAEYEQLYSEHDEEIQSVQQRNAQNEQYLLNLLTTQDSRMNEEMEELRSSNALLEEAMHNSLTSITKLQTERTILIDTLQALSLQTLCALNTR